MDKRACDRGRKWCGWNAETHGWWHHLYTISAGETLSWTPGSGPRCIIQIVLLKQDYAFEDVCAFFHRCANSVAFASVLRMSPCVIWWTTGARVSLWRAEKSELPSSNLSAECVRNCCVCEEPLSLSTNQTFAVCALATSCLPDPFFLSLCV